MNVSSPLIKVKDLPDAVLTAFKAAYPDAKIKEAAKEEDNGQVVYEIESVDGKQKRDILYAPDGTVVEIEETMAFEAQSDVVQKTVKEKYQNAKVEKTEKLISNGWPIFQPRDHFMQLKKIKAQFMKLIRNYYNVAELFRLIGRLMIGVF